MSLPSTTAHARYSIISAQLPLLRDRCKYYYLIFIPISIVTSIRSSNLTDDPHATGDHLPNLSPPVVSFCLRHGAHHCLSVAYSLGCGILTSTYWTLYGAENS